VSTPPGVRAFPKPPRSLAAGDHVVVVIDRVGRLSDPVIEGRP
jgi:2-keto-4-pentenoate hydratase/2-oxohepta-3-ene-1,7-dioic acid hydratase in catechol pathway